MRMPTAHKTQTAALDKGLTEMKATAQKLFVFGQKEQSEAYCTAAEKFNAAATIRLGRENVGFVLMVTK